LALAFVGGRAEAFCPSGGISPEAAPEVTHLRAYRAGFRSPSRVALDAQDNLYIADPRKGTVLVRSPDGRVLEQVTGLGNPLSIAVDGQGRVLLGDGERGAVTVYDAQWTALFDLGGGDGEFGLPGDIDVELATGKVFVSDSEADVVRVYDAAGQTLGSFGGFGRDDGQLDFPSGIFVDGGAGEVYVADQQNFRIQVFGTDGSFLRCLGNSRSSRGSSFPRSRLLSVPQGLWVDSAGRIYVADAFEGQVRVVDQLGREITDIGTHGPGPAQLRQPLDLALDTSGRLFVTSATNGRLEIFGLDAFVDVEAFVPANVVFTPGQVDLAEDEAVTARIEVPGYRIADVDPETVEADGVLGTVISSADADGDGEPDLEVRFLLSALANGLAVGQENVLTVRGTLGALQFDGLGALDVVSSGAPDADGDGVDDASDRCADTGADEIVDARGCSVAQICPCEAQRDGRRWLRHGAHVRCVMRATRSMIKDGLMSRSDRREVVRAAARSSCGKTPRRARRHRRRGIE
jgi:DNA-binding beta-propeller fold protein YncE